MRLQCPNCLCDLEVLASDPSTEVKCPSCGSQVNVGSHLETTVYVAPRLGRFGPFELIERIGRGHFGDVFKARDLRLDRLVAVKVPRINDLSEADAEAFRHEARTAARLRHPNIVTIHEVDSVGDTVYIASELIDGVNLADLMSGRRMQPRKAAEVGATVAEALQHAHEQGIVHRDLKPRNIMLDESGVPHLLDFGLAKQLASEFTITTEGDILGTPAYMSPEQARGESNKADARTDVYSLGVTLFEMLTGQRPFSSNARGLIYQILHEEPPLPRKLAPEVPRDLETICLKAMSKSPEARYATAGEMAADLRRYLAGEPIKARRAGLVERGWRWCCRNPALTASGSLAAAALLALSVLVYAGNGDNPLKRDVVIDIRLAQGPYQLLTDPQATEPVRLVIWALDRVGNPLLDKPAEDITRRPPLRVQLAAGDYFVIAVGQESGRFHEVFRRVPRTDEIGSLHYRQERWDHAPGNAVKLADISLPLASVSEGMVHIPASDDFVMGDSRSTEVPQHHRRVPSFLLDKREVTIADFARSGQFNLPTDLAAAPKDNAVTLVMYDQAVSWAEAAGKMLPTETMYELAATGGGTRRYPWGDDAPRSTDWPMGASSVAPHDRTPTNPPVLGLYSNVAEWTSTWMQFYPRIARQNMPLPSEPRDSRVVRGAPCFVIAGAGLQEDAQLGPRNRCVLQRGEAKPTIGFRCARSVRPHLAAADFEQVVRDYP